MEGKKPPICEKCGQELKKHTMDFSALFGGRGDVLKCPPKNL